MEKNLHIENYTDGLNIDMEEIEMVKTSVWESIKNFLGMVIYSNKDESIVITVGLVILIIVVLIITSIVLGLLQRFLSRKLPIQNKRKFTPIFSFTKWIIYLIVILVTFNSIGINVTAIFAASAVLLVGVGLALQTFFQDLLAGAFILMDQTVHVGDIIEIEDKVSRITAINLRTTRAVTRDNKVLIMPNHKYLTSSLYNWTQNDNRIRESVTVGVAYGSDVQLVKNYFWKPLNLTQKL